MRQARHNSVHKLQRRMVIGSRPQERTGNPGLIEAMFRVPAVEMPLHGVWKSWIDRWKPASAGPRDWTPGRRRRDYRNANRTG